jgi:hypothetical protein
MTYGDPFVRGGPPGPDVPMSVWFRLFTEQSVQGPTGQHGRFRAALLIHFQDGVLTLLSPMCESNP